MTQKRKAELQRKLSMAPVAKPPSGLVDRLKADIPEYLDARRDRERLAHSVAFTMRVAASVILLVASVFLTIQLLSRDERGGFDLTSSEAPAAAPTPAAVPEAAIADASEVAAETTAEVAQEAPAAEADRRQDAPLKVAEARRTTAAQNRSEVAERRSAAPPAVIGGGTGAVTGAVAQDTASDSAPQPAFVSAPSVQTSARDTTAMTEEAAPAAPAAPPPPPVAVPTITRARTDSARLAAAGRSAQFAKAERASVFGISTDPMAFRRVQDTIERGEKPAAPAVDVAALVNHFAGEPEVAPREVELQVEASRIPLATDGRAVIRYTVDSAIATTARLTIEVRPAAMESHRVFGGDVGPVEEVLAPGQSVTGLMEVRVRKPASPTTTVAKVILEYRTSEGRQRTLSREIRIMDLTRTWPEASRRHRLATLAAIWGESLQAAETAGDIAETATELSRERPEDERARELAAAATASSRRRSSAPTGSGR